MSVQRVLCGEGEQTPGAKGLLDPWVVLVPVAGSPQKCPPAAPALLYPTSSCPSWNTGREMTLQARRRGSGLDAWGMFPQSLPRAWSQSPLTCSGLRRSCTHWYSMLVIWWSRQLLLNSRLW